RQNPRDGDLLTFAENRNLDWLIPQYPPGTQIICVIGRSLRDDYDMSAVPSRGPRPVSIGEGSPSPRVRMINGDHTQSFAGESPFRLKLGERVGKELMRPGQIGHLNDQARLPFS